MHQHGHSGDEHHHHHGHHHGHSHGCGGPLSWLRHTFAHSHDVADEVDAAMATNERGTRTLKVSRLGLGATGPSKAAWSPEPIVLYLAGIRDTGLETMRALARPQHIDICLYLRYDAGMSTRTRPTGCCPTPNVPTALPATEHERMVAAFKALADPTRLDVFRLIAAQEEPLCVCDVVDQFGVSQPTISHHLKVLREAELITVSRRGVWAYYAATPRGLALLRASVDAFTPVRLEAAG